MTETSRTPDPGLDAITRDDLLHALTGFYLAVRDYRGYGYAGQIDLPDKVADALYATLSRIAAERRPERCACPCGCLAPGRRDDDGTPGWCDSCRMNIHVEAAPAAGEKE